MTRLDKILCDASVGSRKECAHIIKRGLVTVDGKTVKTPDQKVDENLPITVDGCLLEKHREVVCVMNKPKGYVTSTDDPRDITVMELLPQEFLNQKVVPVGRLDKDTEGLLLFSNNGELIHKLISPKSNIPKTYNVEHDGVLTDKSIQIAKQGVVLKDGTLCKSAVICSVAEGKSLITITEGQYHQVKRMFAALGCHVTSLKRVSFGGINLDDLPLGKVRELTPEEIMTI